MNSMLKKISLIILVMYSYHAKSQNNIDFYNGKSILKEYIKPLSNGIAAGLSNGWFNTAKPHKFGGFDFTITGNIVLIPKEVKTFNINDVGGGTFSGGTTPTIVGNTNPAEIAYNNTTMSMPSGLNIPFAPIPIIQAGIGLIKKTEINIRYIPNIKNGNVGKIGLYGIGFKHDLLQWIPIVSKLPIDLALQAGYTKLNSTLSLSDVLLDTKTEANLEIEATTINIILSKKLLMFTPYLGVGYNSFKTSLNIDTDYSIGALTINSAELTNMTIESNNAIRANIGFRFNITILALQANYTISDYPTATIGAGISLR